MQGKSTIPKNTKQNSQNAKTKTSHQTAECCLSLSSSSSSSWRWCQSSCASVSTGCLGFVCDVISTSLWWVSSACVNDVLIPRIVSESSCTFVLGFGALLLQFFNFSCIGQGGGYLCGLFVGCVCFGAQLSYLSPKSDFDHVVMMKQDLLSWYKRICICSICMSLEEGGNHHHDSRFEFWVFLLVCLLACLQQLREMFCMIFWVSIFASCKRKL